MLGRVQPDELNLHPYRPIAASYGRSPRHPTHTSRLAYSCRSKTGMENFRWWETADGQAASAIRKWQRPYGSITPQLRMTPDTTPTTQAVAACSPRVIPRRSPILRIEPCMKPL